METKFEPSDTSEGLRQQLAAAGYKVRSTNTWQLHKSRGAQRLRDDGLLEVDEQYVYSNIPRVGTGLTDAQEAARAETGELPDAARLLKARADRERANAELAKLQLERESGKLVDRSRADLERVSMLVDLQQRIIGELCNSIPSIISTAAGQQDRHDAVKQIVVGVINRSYVKLFCPIRDNRD